MTYARSSRRPYSAALAGLACIAVSVGMGVGAQPAQAAVALDASGVDFSFVNAVDVLSGAAAGDAFTYENVATISGTQIDATLTVLESFNSLATDLSVFVNQNAINIINPLKLGIDPAPAALVKTGCYADVLVNGDPFGSPTTDTVPAGYLVGSEVFNSATSFDAGSDFVVGSRLMLADGADPANPVDDRRINTELQTCGGADFSNFPDITYYEHPGYVRYEIAFTTGVAKTPVLLKNLTLSAFDIDGGQYLRLSSPLPDSYRVFDTSLLEICGPAALTNSAGECAGDYAGPILRPSATGGDALEFYGDKASDDGEVYEWAAEATYTQPLSSLTYQYGVRNGSSGSSLSVGFDAIDWTADADTPMLADTGASDTASASILGIGVLALLLGGLLALRRTPRAMRR